MLLNNGLTVEKDFENCIEVWKVEPEIDTDDEDGAGDDSIEVEADALGAFPVHIIPLKDYDMPEIQDAIAAEISKYKSFNAFKEVEDDG